MTSSGIARKLARGFSDCSHRLPARPSASPLQIPPRARGPAPTGPRPFWASYSDLPADALAQLDRLALLLAPLERVLEDAQQCDQHGEGDDQTEAEEGDDAVVGLSDEPLAVVARERRRGQEQPGGEGYEGDPHTLRNDTRPGERRAPSPRPAARRPSRGSTPRRSGRDRRAARSSAARPRRRRTVRPASHRPPRPAPGGSAGPPQG